MPSTPGDETHHLTTRACVCLCPAPPALQVLTIIKQDASAAAVGGVYALLFLLSGSLMLVASAIVTALGLGPFLTIMATLHLACTVAAFIHIIRSCSDGDDMQMPQRLLSTQGSAVFLRSAYRVVSTSLKEPAAAQAGGAGSAQATNGCRTAGSRGCCGSSAGSEAGKQGGCGCKAVLPDAGGHAAASQSAAASAAPQLGSSRSAGEELA